MTKIDSLLLLSLGELLVVTSLVSILMVAFAVIRKRRDRGAAQRLVTHIKEEEGRRQAETENIAQRQYGMEGQALERLVNKIYREEKVFYQHLINLYLKRDADALATLYSAFEGATEPYRNLELTQVPGETSPEEEDEHSAELIRMQGENERLSEELTITKDTLGRMLSEYASMYAGGTGEALDKEKMLEMFRAEAIAQAAESKQQPESATTTANESSGHAPGEEMMGSNGGNLTADGTVEFESVHEPNEIGENSVATEVAELPPAEEGRAPEGQGSAVAGQDDLGIDPDTLDELMSLDDDLGGGPMGTSPKSGVVEDSRVPVKTQGRKR